MRACHRERPELHDRLFELLDLAFPGLDLSGQARAARRLGCRWREISVPFVYFESGRLAAHVGVLEIPAVLEGRSTTLGGIHAVATHPEHRGRGLFAALMDEALGFCAARFESVVLTTERPSLYEPHGFRVVPECRFVAPARELASRGGLRRLDPGARADRSRLHRLLDERTPVSRRLGIAGERSIFCFNEARRPLHVLEELDLVLSFELDDDGTLRVFDVVGSRLPSLDELLARLPGPCQRVELCFAPDRLDARLEPEPPGLQDDFLMVRGPFAPEGRPLMLPRPARC